MPLSGQTLTFNPEVWAAELKVALEAVQVFASPLVVNRNYEGDIAGPGDTVHITSLVDPTIRDYTAHSDITIDTVSDDDETLVVDQAKYFAFEVDDLEKRFAIAGGVAISESARRAAYKLRTEVDTRVATQAAADADVQVDAGTLSSPAEAYELLVELSVLLDDRLVPEGGRFVVVTPAFHGQLLLDNRFVGAGTSNSVLTNGLVGQAAGFTVVKSTNVADGDNGKAIIAGNNNAITYAEALTEVESSRMEKRFADLAKGLLVYGSKVCRPEQLVAADVIVSNEFSS
jgi:hypothetical protein